MPLWKPIGRALPAGLAVVALAVTVLPSQDRLKSMPGYDQYTRAADPIA